MMVVLGMLASPVPRASAGACATIRHFETSFAAAAGTTLPADGGVLFAPTLASGRPDAAAGPNDPPRESLRRGTRALPSTRIELAPGWVVLRPRARTTGAIRAMAGSSERDFTMARASTEPLAPPSGPRLRFYPSRQVQGGPRGPSTAAAYNTLTISAPAPAGTFGIVVRNAPAAGRPAAADGFAVPLDAPDQVSFSFNNAVAVASPAALASWCSKAPPWRCCSWTRKAACPRRSRPPCSRDGERQRGPCHSGSWRPGLAGRHPRTRERADRQRPASQLMGR
jgi:hypothetical protein